MEESKKEEPKTDYPCLSYVVRPKINLAFQQNAVPIISELVVANDTEKTFENLTLQVESDPQFASTRIWTLDRLQPDTRFHVTDEKIDVSHDFLADLKEAVRGSLTFTLKQGDTVLDIQKEEVEVLAKDEWGGNTILPEIIAAFVQPNDPAVEVILRNASKRLRSANHDGSFDGYQSKNPQRVATVVSAVWSAISGLKISYAVPPASFEKIGQKIRPPSQILERRLATCLDLSLLFASCLEQAGLNPLIIFTKGHAFPGCWLQDEGFSHSVIDDLQSIRKREQLKELLVFETTLAARTPAVKFSFAVHDVNTRLQNEGDYDLAVDIKRARMSGIRPVYEIETPKILPTGKEEEIEIPLDIIEGLPQSTDQEVTEEPVSIETPAKRLERWKRKLLDLTLRNRMLNFKPRKRAVWIECPDPAKLEDILADGKPLKVLPMPTFEEGSDPRSERLYQEQRQENLRREYCIRALNKGELLVAQTEDKLYAQLLELYRAAKSANEEGGSNILYLAIGFLVWVQDKKPDCKIKAPLILIPVQLSRKSVRSGFRLAIHEDEPRFNPTLLEMLRKDFKLPIPELEGELPMDDHGLDVQKIWNRVRREIRDIQGWELVEDVVLSTFSFAKYLMWKDLEDRTDQLKNNPVVKHLIDSPREPYQGNEGEFPIEKRLDDELRPDQTFCPLLADSTQLTAVIAAAKGRDFVLIGPPGTGKSQTIANMIAQCLAEGKKVLFVSEKTAALDVVYRRLNEVGLGDFCLELHSNKARRIDVLKQLEQAWESKGSMDADLWREKADRLRTLRDQLNVYVRRLHKMHPNGWTIYMAIGEVVHNRYMPEAPLSWPDPDGHDKQHYKRLVEIAKNIDANAEQTGGIPVNPFRGIARGEWSPSWQKNLMESTQQMRTAVEGLNSAIEQYLEATSFPISQPSMDQLNGLISLHSLLVSAHGESYYFAADKNSGVIIKDLQAGIHHLKLYRRAWSSLSLSYKQTATQLDLDGLSAQWDQAKSRWLVKRWIDQNRVRKALQAVTRSLEKPHFVGNDLDQLKIAFKEETNLKALNYLGSHIGKLWNGIDSNINNLEQAVKWAGRLQSILRTLVTRTEDLVNLKSCIQQLLGEGNDLLAPEGLVDQRGQTLKAALQNFDKALNQIVSLTDTSRGDLLDPKNATFLDQIHKQCESWLSEEHKLKYWCTWRAIRQKAIEMNLAPLVQTIENSETQGISSERLFRVNYCRWWLNAVIDRDEVLKTFVPAQHELLIKDFRQLDQEFLQLTCQYIRARLSGQIPNRNDVNRGPEWSTLSRELQKTRRHKPLRQLINEMPTTLTRLTPCLMMSPLSIAQHLSTDTALFDVVIFDEASQIPIWDAIGAIARGRQTIIVGDPKQLPPTSFFERRDDDELDGDAIEDLESILDECIGSSIPELNLNWHYRSLNESLITFSNHRYYEGRLITFPSSITDDQAVQYHHVAGGVYEKGKARINQKEAKAIVTAVVGLLRQSNFEDTIGVVTFNMQQQILIQDLLEAARRNYPEIEKHFAEGKIEPVFVKNIESVQGDERDIVFFSITYGPDITGKVSVNFGPMNQQGGPRRLNVAITRARKQMHIYATLRPEQIDLSRTNAKGVRDLKHFLEFAEQGPRALAEAIERPIGEYESFFEAAVGEALTEKGWILHPQVGVSGFRIDLGVVHPDAQGRYLAGVECDGATYHRSATARDRDFLREQVLRQKGWEILRIWSTDWWTDSKGATNKVHTALEQLLEKDRNKKETEENNVGNENFVAVAENLSANPIEHDSELNANVLANIEDFQQGGSDPGNKEDSDRYREANLSTFSNRLNPEAFESRGYSDTLRDLIQHILDEEAPLRMDILIKRIAQAHGFGRAGNRIRKRISRLISKEYPRTREKDKNFIWPRNISPESWGIFREADGMKARSAEEIPIEELKVLAKELFDKGYERQQIVIEMGHRLGLQRIRKSTRDRLESAIPLSAPLFEEN